jgi:hypothetical protein
MVAFLFILREFVAKIGKIVEISKDVCSICAHDCLSSECVLLLLLLRLLILNLLRKSLWTEVALLIENFFVEHKLLLVKILRRWR